MIILHLMQTNHFYDALKENVQGRRKLLKEKKISRNRKPTGALRHFHLLLCFFVLFYYYGYYLTMFICFVLLLWLLSYYVSLFCFITMATNVLLFFISFIFHCFVLLLWPLMFYFSLYRPNEACPTHLNHFRTYTLMNC